MMRPKSIQAIGFLLISAFVLIWNNVYSQPSKDGAKTITNSGVLVNDYSALTVDATAGSSVITVASNAFNSNFTNVLGAGDLLFIIQIQGATMVTLDDPSYGNITSYNNCGNNEFCQVASVFGGTSITLACPLQHNYTAAGRVLVVRVPRYSSLTINPGASISCIPWQGNAGSIIAIEIAAGGQRPGQVLRPHRRPAGRG